MTTRYKIEINATGAGGADPRDGFIDRKTIEQYMASGSTPSSLGNSMAKERANIRFDFFVQQLQREANVYVTSAVTTGATANVAGTAFTATVEVERGDSVLYTLNEADNNAVLTGEAALEHWVARALVSSRATFGDYYDPTEGTAPGNDTPAARRGVRVEQIVVGSLADNLTDAKALVTVTKL